MDAFPQEDRDRITPTGEIHCKPDISMQQPLSPQDERLVSENPSPDAAIIGSSRDVREQRLSSSADGDLRIVPPAFNAYASQEQSSFGGFANSTGTRNAYTQYHNAGDCLHVSQVMYNDNASLVFHSAYGFNPEMAYGQYSPVATPLPSIMLEGQLYSPQQIPFSPSFYPQVASPNVPSPVPLSPSELMTSESSGDNLLFGPGSGYFVHFSSFGGGNLSGTPGSSFITSPTAYPQPMGILGPYEHHVGQASQQLYGLTSTSSAGHYQYSGSYQNSKFGSGSYSGPNDRACLIPDKGRRREGDLDSISVANDSLGFDRNRGPRALKPGGKSTIEQSSPSVNGIENSSTLTVKFDSYNRLDFVTDYKHAKFFIIKSFSEDNVHKSIKYNVWASTPHGNKKLDAAYQEAKEMGNCPVFLLFSVNASGQFCGVAEMVGPVDFEKDADYWQQDRWSGQFPVQWHIIKDVPNSRFRHIMLENNDNKPVTHSRDSQEVKLEQGLDMLKIFKDHVVHTSILDDFGFYDQRERATKERKAKQQVSSIRAGPGLVAGETINHMSDNFAQGLQLNDGSKERAASDMTRTDSVTSQHP